MCLSMSLCESVSVWFCLCIGLILCVHMFVYVCMIVPMFVSECHICVCVCFCVNVCVFEYASLFGCLSDFLILSLYGFLCVN